MRKENENHPEVKTPVVVEKDTKQPVPESSLPDLLKQGNKVPFYTSVQPMLATLVDKAFDKDDWIYEVKWDGYRAVAFRKGDVTELKSRNDKSFNEKFYPIYQALANWQTEAVLDGEIVVVNENGTANFGALQNWRSEADGDLLYYVFDLLWYRGMDIKNLPLFERKAILEQILPTNSLIKLSADFDTSGIEFLEAAKKMGLEGIMAKHTNSTYQPGNRTRDWLKIKANKRQEVVIGGYTLNDGSKKPFSSLLVGVFEKEGFVYTGKIGTGFDIKTQKAMMEQFKPLITQKPPFSVLPDVNKPSRFRQNPPNATVTWLRPELICEVSFTEMTSDGVMRHPSFEGLREDKKAKEVGWEKETKTERIVKEAKVTNDVPSKMIQPQKKRPRQTLLNPTDKTQVRTINGYDLKFTNLDKVFWPDAGITKRDLINYYYQVAPFILPYLVERPQTLNRFPNGIDGFSFYQKNVTGKVPAWAKTYLYHSETDDEDKHYLLGNDEQTLLYMAGLACIELHPWSSTIQKPDHPTWCIIDLDPDKNSFEQVIQAARVTKQVLDSKGVPSYCKTSGSTGLHIYIPLGAAFTYEESKEFARGIVTQVNNELPKFTTIERLTAKREGKMYLDFLQNRPHATVAAPYSLRPRPGAPVSMPLHWEEVKPGLKITDYNLFNAIDRMQEMGDLFQPVLGKGVSRLVI